ncbi:type I restriction endonuclease subunit R [Wohlfahrtiimonas chitiniclastica]|uniref:type I restriction endonuclease subunit R n=1 Tax=Wohlfahrtiimonas chitiniclastica TaxID=400946 RepID=UPI000B996D35|nr:type I restriction endonuclease subunit R [Wohlfahrtiimonas chitiniclastica]OYQ75965.1 deoxyribonuclease HsdR [Wohlfahrtiimonas chitiniclastica]
MAVQSEYELEQALLNQLAGVESDAKSGLGYEFVDIHNETMMLQNLRKQLEIHNNLQKNPFTDDEFKRVLDFLCHGNSVFERSKRLRDFYQLKREDGSTKSIRFLNCHDWCQNEYQVTNQFSSKDTIKKSRKTRYDVTILINGLPLVQIELKRRGVELKEAYNQIDRYHRDSFWNGYGLYLFTQLYVISNGVNTKYFANNYQSSFDFTFFWADKENNIYSDLKEFTNEFLRPCHVSKMITHYTVLHETDKCLMVFRPYQYYAAEALIERAKTTSKNAYIWHTTGSGKTLTSFKVSQVIKELPDVDLVMFVVDRKDLDYQTAKEFNAYSDGCVDTTNNTNTLIQQITSPDRKLIVTTIQKLNNAVTSDRYSSAIEHLKDKKVVFIFDECHRSQFGETHQNIKRFFHNAQMFGFTGTPILDENVNMSAGIAQTTKDIFDECLHKYVIVDAIRDNNVLKFAVEYVGKYKNNGSKTEIDIETKSDDVIETKELLEDERRLEKIANYILDQHNSKTFKRLFSAMFCVSNVATLVRYYDLFEHLQAERLVSNPNYKPLKIATIFSFVANEEDPTKSGIIGQIPDEDPDLSNGRLNQSNRDHLDRFMAKYNAMYKTKYSTNDSKSFYNYYTDIARRVKEHGKSASDDQIDILLVVNMFLTGFDSKTLNTLYVDKNLQYHGLVQAFSRTNRVYNATKSHGNIVCFRNLKEKTDKAIALFSDKNAKESAFVKPYDEYIEDFNIATEKLLELTPLPKSVDTLVTEEEQLEFVTAFRDLLRLQTILKSFTDYDEETLEIDPQSFLDFKTKYMDLYDQVKSHKLEAEEEKESILDQVDFQMELIQTDLINVTYIMNLLRDLCDTDRGDLISVNEEFEDKVKNILGLVEKDPKLRNKLPLFKKFIQDELPKIASAENFDAAMASFWDDEKAKAGKALVAEEDLKPEAFKKLIENYVFTNDLPDDKRIADLLVTPPKIMDRKKTIERIKAKIGQYIEQFIEDV